MSFLKNLFGKKEEPIHSYADFWNWFADNEKSFFNAVQSGNIPGKFFKRLEPALDQVHKGIYYLTGMYDDDTAELILGAEGTVKNIVFVEELVNAAPAIKGWKFTALKQSREIDESTIQTAGYEFNKDNLSFYSNDDADYPDEIDITVVHNDSNNENKKDITYGVYLFLDNYLGEENFASIVDNLSVKPIEQAEKQLIPIEKLKHYLTWRQKEFIEKYEATWYDSQNDTFSILEGKLKTGRFLIAVMNNALLRWDSKASHPWILTVEIKYNGENNNGMPDKETYQFLDEIEKEIQAELKDFEGYLTIGRQTANGFRDIYFACKEFRKPSKVVHEVQRRYAGTADMSYDIRKDKYWKAFDRFEIDKKV